MKFLYIPILVFAVVSSSCDQKSTAAVVSPELEKSTAPEIPKIVTFNAHIRPIFSNTCFACHGFDAKTRKEDLRLDTPEGAYAKLKNSDERAIVPGKPDESAILKRIFSSDPDDVMPPPDFHKDLTNTQKALVRAWIEQGAKYEEHWSFSPVVKAPVPKPTGNKDEIANPIDAFVLSSLETEKLKPSPLADKATLLRRLSLDLTGLPPSPRELDSFLADQSPDAYRKQVERLLASPHYGERMAVPWLDVVRFADTVGYHGDQNVRIFPYRDYVIKAFNDNKPFDQFTIEQLAGDLLPNPSDEQLTATGFLRLNLMTREGGAQPKEYLAKYLGDRVRAVGAAWMGLTTGCAECHDHKFDPITAKDYYSLGAFFADLREWGVYADYEYTPNPDIKGFNNDFPFPPELQAINAATLTRLAKLQASAVDHLAGLIKPENQTEIDEWATATSVFLTDNPTGWDILLPSAVKVIKGTPFEISEDGSVLFSGPGIKEEILTIDLPLPAVPIRAIRLEALPSPQNAGKVGRQSNGKFAVTPSFVIVDENASEAPLTLAWSQADRRTPHKYNNGQDSPLLEAEWRSAPAPWEEPQDAASHTQHAVYHLTSTSPASDGRVLRVTLASADIGRVRFSITPFGDAIPGNENALRNDLTAALSLQPANRSESHQKEIGAAWLLANKPESEIPESYKNLRSQIIDCRGGFAHSLVAQSVPADKIPSTHLLPRGNWMAPAEEVKPAVPHFLPHASVESDGSRLTRLDLAKWLVDAENPLTSRQFSNRLWKQFFGKGLSNVLDDLGNQGEWPSHPKLLDWLALEFRESGWDVKHMVRLMVNSRTYRQQAAMRADLVEKDPFNRLLGEQAPRRLDAEFIRDNALFISGLLKDDIIGGPSVKPYQPPGYYVNLNFPERDYGASLGDDQYRRGIYMHWQRTFMHPMLAGFDAPSRETCTADRFQSNSPQQALTLLNDPSFVEAARGFALRILGENEGAGEAEKIHHAMRLALSREAKPNELESLTKFLATQLDQYKSKPEDAIALLKTGQSNPVTGRDPAELAAWVQLCRVILNLHETITRY